MKRFAIAAVLLCGITARAQLTTVTASSVKIGGVPIASGTVTFTPVNQQRQPIPFVTGGGGLNAPKAFKCQIAAGAITGTCQVPDAAQTVPANILYSVEVTDSASQSAFVMIVPGITGTTWPLDQYAPAANTTNVQPLQISYGTAAPTGSCVSPSLYVRNAQGGQLYICVGGSWVVVGGTANGALSYTTLTPASLTNTNLLCAGDSRCAGSSVPAGQGFMDYIALQPQFASRATFFNGGTAGATCTQMTSDYATKIRPHKPSGSITIAYLFIEEGINDIGGGVTLPTLESCWSSYVSTAVADGFTPVVFTVYFWTGANDTQESNRQTFNQWLRTTYGPNYLVIDMDSLFPPSTGSPYYIDSIHFNGLGNQLWAQGTNFLWGLGKSGTNMFTNMEQNIYTPINGLKRFYSPLVSGIAPQTGLSTGAIASNISATVGQFLLGADGNCSFSRQSSTGTILFTNGCGPFQTITRTASFLPTCNSSSEGAMVAVTDATVNTWGTAITAGGGSNHVLGYCDGTSWTVAGK